MRYSFMNDYSEGAHPRILNLLGKINLEQNSGYGLDIHSEKAKKYIRTLIKREDADIYFIPGGTQANLLTISSFLRPHQSVIAADTGHIIGHEAGAIEATGHQIVISPGIDGKLTPDGIQRALDANSEEYTTQPKMVYVSNSTELGTIYTKDELTAIHHICEEKGLILFLDGARLGSALTSKFNDLEISDVADLVDVFYIGGTKNGALLGEAIVILREDLKEDFRYLIKQRGAMLAKGFLLGAQFEALFEDNLFFELASHANNMAEKIANIFVDAGIKFYTEPLSNQLFPIFSNDLIEKMSKEFSFSEQKKIDEENTVVRLVTSWATTEESVDALRRFFA